MSIERAEADLARARAEVARLTTQLRAAESRVLKLENFLEVARSYEAPEAEDVGRHRNGGPPLVVAAIEIIRERGARQQTRLLVEELERRGHHIGGSNKITNLSGALSRSPLLLSNRVEGWGLREWASGNGNSITADEQASSLASSEPTGLPSHGDHNDNADDLGAEIPF